MIGIYGNFKIYCMSKLPPVLKHGVLAETPAQHMAYLPSSQMRGLQ
jgi:hypothetical protein